MDTWNSFFFLLENFCKRKLVGFGEKWKFTNKKEKNRTKKSVKWFSFFVLFCFTLIIIKASIQWWWLVRLHQNQFIISITHTYLPIYVWSGEVSWPKPKQQQEFSFDDLIWIFSFSHFQYTFFWMENFFAFFGLVCNDDNEDKLNFNLQYHHHHHMVIANNFFHFLFVFNICTGVAFFFFLIWF